MLLTHARLHRLRLPLVTSFRTSFGNEAYRNALLIEVAGPDTAGWGECVAELEPLYTPEYTDGAVHVITHFLLPRINGSAVEASGLHQLFLPVKGHQMAKAGIEAAVLDAECRLNGTSLSARLGGKNDRVPAGVAVGICDSLGALLDAVEGFISQGYGRIKLKIEPGNDIAQVSAVRERFPEVLLQVDANSAYRISDVRHLAQLDAFGLLLLEQPLPDDDLSGHAELAKHIETPICLDESIGSPSDARDAIALGACQVINIKPGRVGGYLEAVKIHDLCVHAGIAVWCGGMLETGVGRAGNLALAALPGFSLPGDLSASDRYFHQDVTDAFVLEDGHIRVPAGPGIGVTPLLDRVAQFTVSTQTIALSSS